MNIGIDIDGVLAALNEAVIPFINQEMDTNYVPEDVTTWDFLREAIGSEERLLEIMDYVFVIGRVNPIEPNPHESIAELKELGHEVTIISKRTWPSHPAVVSWLHSLGLKYDNLVFMGSGDKLDYPIDALVDDHPRVPADARRHPFKQVFLYDQPWNSSSEELPENVLRVSSLVNVVEFLRERKES